MRKTINVLWILCLLGVSLLLSGKGLQGADDSEPLTLSVTNRVRAYPLRAKDLEELASRHPEKAFPVLVELLKNSQEMPFLRYLAARKLSEIDRNRAAQIFKNFLDDPRQDAFARKTALAEWAPLEPARLKQKVREILDDRNEDPAVRQYALALLGQQEGGGRIEKLRTLVRAKQETLSLRTNALFELERLGDLEFVRNTVRQFLADRNEPEALRRSCVLLADRLEDPEALTLLRRISEDDREPEGLRQVAEAALSTLSPSHEPARRGDRPSR